MVLEVRVFRLTFKILSSSLLSEEKGRRNQSWKAIFISTYSDLGRYIQYYATLKKAWDDLEKYLGQRCPRMIGSLKGTV